MKEKPSTTLYEKYMFAVGPLGQLLFFVQGFKIFSCKSAHDISFLAFSISLISVTSWFIYGVKIKNKVLVVANLFAMIGALFVLTGVLLYG